MASALATRRLRKELMAIRKKPIENIVATPLETNILEWHYVITGTKGTPYDGGFYHGKLVFPKEYPLKPPGVLMFTPNGRFKTNRRLCLSMSDFHPETWNPMWSVSSILTGLYSFMLDSAHTHGSMEATTETRKQLAAASLAANCKDAHFCRLFPELVELHEARLQERADAAAADVTAKGGGEEEAAAAAAAARDAANAPAATSLQSDAEDSIGPAAAICMLLAIFVGLLAYLAAV